MKMRAGAEALRKKARRAGTRWRPIFVLMVLFCARGAMMASHGWALYLPLLAALAWAALGDLRNRRIRNELTLPLLAAGLLQGFLPIHTAAPMQSLAGFAVAFALTFILFAMGALGGGDVKLMAGVGAWLGALAALEVFAAAAIIGLVIVLVQAARQGRLITLFRNSALLAVNIVHAADVGMDHVSETGQSCRSVDKPLPYAVPVFAAVLLVVAWTRMGT